MMPTFAQNRGAKPLGDLQATSGTRFEAPTAKIRQRRETHIVNGLMPDFSHGFPKRRQVAAYGGLAPTPWQSGSVAREQGVSKAGNPRLRTTMIQLAWLWLRHQPNSALAQWFKERVKRNGRLRKTTIVALARKLLVALWKYVTAGVVVEGAVMKAVS